MITPLQNWEEATQYLAYEFVEKYFGNPEDVDFWWIAEDVGSVLAVNDCFFDLDRIREAIKYKASKKKLFDFYEYELNWHMDKKHKGEPVCPNFRNYLKIKKHGKR